MATLTIKTPLTPGLSPDALVHVLHDHETIIKTLAPAVKKHELVSGDASGSGPCVYNVTAPTPVGTEQTYPLTITNVADGIDTLVQPKPPMGKLEIAGKWRVDGSHLTETVEIDGNFVTKKYVAKAIRCVFLA